MICADLAKATPRARRCFSHFSSYLLQRVFHQLALLGRSAPARGRMGSSTALGFETKFQPLDYSGAAQRWSRRAVYRAGNGIRHRNSAMNQKTRFNIGYAIAAIFAVLLIQYIISATNQIAVIPYSEFQQLLPKQGC